MRIGIIGGTGVYDLEFLEDVKEISVKTQYGRPSDRLIIGKIKGSDNEIVFLPRHGRGHVYNPSNVNYRANIAAMKKIGVRDIIAPAAVGSLNEKIKPGDIVLPDQIVDRTYARKTTFYDGTTKMRKGVCHISFANPFCDRLRKILMESAKEEKIKFHEKATCVVIEGPRFSTKAESNLYRSWKCDIINMTIYPECVLAREAEICYASIAMVTDYDCWKEKESVDTEMVIEAMKKNVEKVKRIIMNATRKMKEEDCTCKHSLENAFI